MQRFRRSAATEYAVGERLQRCGCRHGDSRPASLGTGFSNPDSLPLRRPSMRAAVFNEPRSISVTDRPDAAIQEPSDAVVRVVFACVCGSDLWYYRGESPFEPGPIGHEFVGVVEDVGSEVRDIKAGDFV